MSQMVSIRDWQPTDGFVLEEAALKAIKNLNNSLIVAGPGAGKTELLAQKACCLLQTNSCVNPKKILAISFKKDAAINLKDRVRLRLSGKHENRFVSQTFDSFAKSILDRFLYALPEEYRPHPNYEIVDKNQNAIVRAYSEFGIFLDKADVKNQYINYLVENKLPLVEGTIANVWRVLLKGNGNINPTLNFQMITLLAIYILETNPLILKSLRETYTHIFLDEFQDTTNLQYELVKTCFLNTNASITAVGDNRQRIMLWAGAKPDIFDCFEKDFISQKYTLIMNHRSAPRLLEIQRIVNNYLQKSPLSPLPNEKWSKDDGIAELWYFENSRQEAEIIATKIKELLEVNKVPCNEICILVKQTVYKYSNLIVEALDKLNINSRDETIFQDLLKEDIVLLIINTLKTALNTSDSDAWLWTWNSKLLFEGITGTKNDSLFDKLRKDLKQFLKIVNQRLNSITCSNDLKGLIGYILGYFDISKIKKYYSQYSRGSYIAKLQEDTVKYLYVYFQKTKDWLTAIEDFEGKNSVPIMTIHKSKGLEYEAVFFIGFDDDAFWSFTFQEHEDTCTFFVGLSRAVTVNPN